MAIVALCDRFNTLPVSGGLLDQDSFFVFLLSHFTAWEAERQALDEAKAKQKAQLTS